MARPRKPSPDKRSRKIVLWVNEIERARYLINAAQSNLTPADFGRHRLCRGPDAESTMGGDAGPAIPNREHAFARVDALNRVGTSLARLVHIVERTGHVPSELAGLIAKLDQLLDRELAA